MGEYTNNAGDAYDGQIGEGKSDYIIGSELAKKG